MLLSDLTADLPDARLVAGDVDVRGVADDSRRVVPGDLFVCVRGLTVDGHDFARGAVERGAAALVVERELPLDVPQVLVASAERALGVLAARFAGRPGDRLRLVGVTGTNGKTTTTYLVEAMLAAAGKRPGVIGTVSFRYAGREVPATFTTPAPLELHALFGAMAEAGTTDVIMETSSAALAMERLSGVRFAVAAFSNLTQDHLDVHGTMDAYFAAKARLFSERLAPDGVAVAMIDDPRGTEILARAPGGARRISVSVRGVAEVCVESAESTIAGIRARFVTPRGVLEIVAPALLGEYNLANLGLAIGIGEGLGLPHAAMAAGIAALAGVPGRVQRVANPRGVDVLVDYAHTPDALERVIAALRPLTAGRLIVVFGCGGDRDPTKRPKMGLVVARDADVAVVTSDNPRTEEPDKIIDMILVGIAETAARRVSWLRAGRGVYAVEPERRRAIALAVRAAGSGDLVLIAGKGHEDYQILGKTKVHFDDREEALAAAQPDVILADVVAGATGGALSARAANGFAGVGIDGRAVQPGELFVAVRGERFDGHDFLAQAAAAGADGFVVERGRSPGVGTVVEVDDTRIALGEIGRAIRKAWNGPLVAVTGSTGKTSTKQLIGAMLVGVAGDAAKVVVSEGSLNNETGVPLTLARLRPQHRFGVVEMGMRGLGQIAYLTRFAEPDVGVVVNAGVAHVGVVGSVEGIARGKSEIWTTQPGGAKWAIYPADDARLAAHAASSSIPAARRLTFGADEGATVRLVELTALGAEGSLAVYSVRGRMVRARIPLVGRHNAMNAACALAVAVALDVDLEAAAFGLGNARPAAQRSEVRELRGRHLLVDCYNANPTSMSAALDTLASLAKDVRPVAVLGDMLELGDTEEHEHETLGRLVAEHGVQHLVTVGERARHTARAARAAGVAHVESFAADDAAVAAKTVAAWARPGDWVLIKASRGMRLERVVSLLAEEAL